MARTVDNLLKQLALTYKNGTLPSYTYSMKNVKNDKKMTLEEYKAKYSKPKNLKLAKSFVTIFELTIGIVVIYFLVSLIAKAFEIHQHFGYLSIGLAVLVLIFGYIIPLVKIKRNLPFITNIRNKNPKEVKKYNAKLRKEISANIVDITAKTDDINWYSTEKVGKLAIALQTNNSKDLKVALSDLMKTDINQSSNKIIRDHAFNVGLTTAISQSDKLDTMFIVVYELNLIKELVYLYGYRPSDYKLMKIYQSVIGTALTTYGLSNVSSNLAGGVVKKLSSITQSIPLLGEAIGIAVDSTLQGVINSSLTVVIGFQTKKYLKEEYRLQEMLDDLIIDDEQEIKDEKELILELKDELSKKPKKSRK